MAAYWHFGIVCLAFFCFSSFLGVKGQSCQLPAGLRNTALTSNAVGKVRTQDSSMVFEEGLRDCSAILCNSFSSSLTFNCEEKQENAYMFKSQEIFDGSNTYFLYICWYIDQQLSSQKWVYYQAPSTKNGFYNSFVLPRISSAPAASFSDVCDLTSPLPVTKYSLLLDTASLTSQSSSCPEALLGVFVTNKQTPTSCATEFDLCNATSTRQTIVVQNPSCRTDNFFTENGRMDCLHSLSENDVSGNVVSYVTTYTPESSSVTFACLVYIQQGDTVYYNMQTSVCEGLTVPTTTSYQVSLEPKSLCPFLCNFPTDLVGTWRNSRTAGEVTVTNTTMTNFLNCNNPPCSGPVNSVQCYRTVNDSYLVRTPVTTVSNESVRIYVCLQLTRLSSTKFLYYQRHKSLQATVNDYAVTFNSGQSVLLAEACDDLSADPYPATRHHVFLKSGSESSSFSACPDGLQGEFRVAGGSCQSSYQTCSDASRIQVTGTACTPKPFFSDGGSLGCLHNVSVSGTTYVTLYNSDASPNSTDTFAFTCVALTLSGIDLKLSQNPLECLDSQTSETINSTNGGALFIYQKTGYCLVPCSFPSALSGQWLNSRTAQPVNFTSSALSGFFSCGSPPCDQAITSLECYSADSTRYVLRSPITIVNNQAVFIYLCLELTALSSTKFLYYRLNQNTDPTLKDQVVTFPYNQTVSLAQACDSLSEALYRGTRHHLFVKSGSENSSFSACPESLKGEFNNKNSACASTYDTCDDDTQLKVTGTACSPKPFYSDRGILGCLHSVSVSGTTYVTLYNRDASPNGTATFAFTCLAAKLSGSTLDLSQNPLQCVDSQTSTSISTSDGALFTYERTGDCTLDIMIIIIIVVVLVILLIIIIVIMIICIICRKKRAAKRKRERDEIDAILTQQEEEEDERGSDHSIDSGYPRSSTQGGSRMGGRGGRRSQALGTPGSLFAEVYEEPEEKGPREANVVGHRRRRRRQRDGEEAYETDGEGDYSDETWEEYVDEDGNKQVRPKRRRRRRRRRKKVKQTYTRTHVLADGTTVEEEVESEYSVTASSDMTSSDDDRESLTDQIRAQKEKRRTRLQKIMDGPVGVTTVIVTREMDERAHQPEKKRRSFFNKFRLRARDRKRKTRVQHGGLFRNEAGKAEVPGVTGKEREIPYLLQYQKKKDIERTLNDEGFFDDSVEKMTAETVFGFQSMDRQLSPKPSMFGTVDEMDSERMVTATESSQSEDKSVPRDRSDSVNEALEGDQGLGKVTSRTKDRHVTIGDSMASPGPSSDSDMKEDDSSGRKSSDTSSGVADLSPSHQPSSPEQNQSSLGSGHRKDSRRISLGWEKIHGLYSRHRLSFQAGAKDGEGTEGRGTASRLGHGKSKHKQDKRVKTALRRLLNERLFGSSDKKKSRREDDVIADSWTNADSVANNVSETSSVAGTRAGTRQTARPVTQGKVAFAEVDSNRSDARGSQGSHKRDELSPARRFKPHDHPHADEDSDDDKNGQERLPTRGGSRLPPLRTPTMAMDRVFTPANYPKWGLCVTASQRSMLVDGLQRDRTFLSRMQAQSAWSSKTDDSMSLPPYSRGTGKGEETAEEDNYLDPHRPDTEETGKENEGEGTWAHRRPPPPGGFDSGAVAFTKSSGRSPLDFDDRRLRRLLEELYRDKKFMDKMINKIDEDHLEFPDHIAAEDVKFLSEFGRQYLLERAQYWELHGPLGPPRPPPTALGMRLNRAQTSLTSDGLPGAADETVTSPRPRTVR